MDDSEGVTAADAFAALGNDKRVAIVRALAEAEGPMSFSDLQDAVEIDDSGQFNYHLGKLVGIFVRQVEPGEEQAPSTPGETRDATTSGETPDAAASGETSRGDGRGARNGGYELTYAGENVLGAILAGTYTPSGFETEFELTEACRDCGEPLQATYENERVTVRCEACDVTISRLGLPPGAFEGRDRAELTRLFSRWILDHAAFATDGICLNCTGVMTGRLLEGGDTLEWTDHETRFECDRCGYTITLSVNVYLLSHPAVAAFYHEHGVDVRDGGTWNLPSHRSPDVRTVETDPLAVVSRIELDDEVLSVRLEEDLSIPEVRRE